MTDYAELQVTSNFSFLRGASHPYELIGQQNPTFNLAHLSRQKHY